MRAYLVVLVSVFLAAIGPPTSISADSFIGTVGGVVKRSPAPAAAVTAPKRSPLYGHDLRVDVQQMNISGVQSDSVCWIIGERLRSRLKQLVGATSNDINPPTDWWEMQIALDVRPGIGVNVGFGRYGRGAAIGTQQVIARMAMTVTATSRAGRQKTAFAEARSSKNVISRLAAGAGGSFASYLADSVSGRDLISSVTDKALEKAIQALGYAER